MLRSAWRSLLHHKLRLVLSGVAIVLGVGFGVLQLGELAIDDVLDELLGGGVAGRAAAFPDACPGFFLQFE